MENQGPILEGHAGLEARAAATEIASALALPEIENRQALPDIENRGPLNDGFRDFAESILCNIDEAFFWCDVGQVKPYFVSAAYENIWGQKCETAYAEPSSWIEAVHPEDRDDVQYCFERSGDGGSTQLEYRILRPDGEERWVWVRTFPVLSQAGGLTRVVGIAQDCTERKQAEKNRAFLASIVESSDDSFIGTDLNGVVRSWNPAAERLFGYTAEEAMGRHITFLYPPNLQADFDVILEKIYHQERVKRFEAARVAKDGSILDVSAIISPISDNKGRLQGILGNYRNIAERKQAERDRDAMEVQLRHAQKLESIGQLAAGIAHEINTPTQYIGDNARFLKEAFRDMEQLLMHYQGLIEAAAQTGLEPGATKDVLALLKSIDVDYLLEEIPKAIDQTLEGVTRVSTLVSAMKEFSHPGTKEKTPVNLNRSIDCTIAVTRNEWRYVAELETEFDQALPLIPCIPGEFNQVVLNLIVNAAHAIADVVKDGSRGKIVVRTKEHQHWVEIQIQDTGNGIPIAVRERIFDPFFTTKEVGQGSGQGLAIARSVVVDKHGGTIHFETETGKGTTFIIRLPLDGTSLPSDSSSSLTTGSQAAANAQPAVR
jgi:PAS domain S-box-containing protein